MYRVDRLCNLIEEGKKANAVDPFAITPSPDLQKLREEGGAAIDLRLGTWFTSLTQARLPYLPLDAPGNASLSKSSYVAFGSSYFLHPQSFVLAVTLEWIRLPHSMTASVQGKSSWGRHGLIIATATGVHPGFKGCLTLELTNVGEIPIEMKPGVKICQLFVQALEIGTQAHAPASGFDGLRRPLLRSIKTDEYMRRLSGSAKQA